jgi:radical SAM-linked protein
VGQGFDREGKKVLALPNRWAVWFEVTGDARFLSHHDVMRLMERSSARAQLPLKYTQGFNPHPKISLPAPRPVGVASQAEMVVLEFSADPPEAWGEALGRQLPPGFAVKRVEELPGTRPPRVACTSYEMPLSPEQAEAVARRLEKLSAMDQWALSSPSRRLEDTQPRAAVPHERPRDLKPRLSDCQVDGSRLRFTLLTRQDGSARPAEVLALMELCGPSTDAAATSAAVSRLVRTRLECES